MNEEDVRRFLGDISPRAAAVTLLNLDKVLARYSAIHGVEIAETDREAIASALRVLVRQDTRQTPEQPPDLESQLHELDREIYRLRQKLIWLRRTSPASPETDAEIERLEQQYDRLGDRFVDLYRQWTQEP